MRLFGLVDGRIDRRDRAQWLMPPFDRTLATGIAGPFRIDAAKPYTATATCGLVITRGSANNL